MPFDATLKALGRDCPADFLSTFGRPPAWPLGLLSVDLFTVTTAADLVVPRARGLVDRRLEAAIMKRVCRPWRKGVPMAGVLCESVGPGMRPSERAVTIRDVRGHSELILVEHDFLTVQDDRTYLPVGVVFIDKERDVVLVEFPHEPLTGGNRAWVRSADLIWPNGKKP